MAPGTIHSCTCPIQAISTVCCANSSVRSTRDGVAHIMLKRFVSMINIHYRRMTYSPIHLTYENTTDFFLRLGMQPPWTHIAALHRKLTTALAHKHQSMMEPDEPQPDVCMFNPTYPPCAMHEYVSPTPPMPQASLACPECHRHFAQAGMLKKHLRQQHQVPYLPEDVFR